MASQTMRTFFNSKIKILLLILIWTLIWRRQYVRFVTCAEIGKEPIMQPTRTATTSESANQRSLARNLHRFTSFIDNLTAATTLTSTATSASNTRTTTTTDAVNDEVVVFVDNNYNEDNANDDVDVDGDGDGYDNVDVVVVDSVASMHNNMTSHNPRGLSKDKEMVDIVGQVAKDQLVGINKTLSIEAASPSSATTSTVEIDGTEGKAGTANSELLSIKNAKNGVTQDTVSVKNTYSNFLNDRSVHVKPKVSLPTKLNKMRSTGMTMQMTRAEGPYKIYTNNVQDAIDVATGTTFGSAFASASHTDVAVATDYSNDDNNKAAVTAGNEIWFKKHKRVYVDIDIDAYADGDADAVADTDFVAADTVADDTAADANIDDDDENENDGNGYDNVGVAVDAVYDKSEADKNVSISKTAKYDERYEKNKDAILPKDEVDMTAILLERLIYEFAIKYKQMPRLTYFTCHRASMVQQCQWERRTCYNNNNNANKNNNNKNNNNHKNKNNHNANDNNENNKANKQNHSWVSLNMRTMKILKRMYATTSTSATSSTGTGRDTANANKKAQAQGTSKIIGKKGKANRTKMLNTKTKPPNTAPIVTLNLALSPVLPPVLAPALIKGEDNGNGNVNGDGDVDADDDDDVDVDATGASIEDYNDKNYENVENDEIVTTRSSTLAMQRDTPTISKVSVTSMPTAASSSRRERKSFLIKVVQIDQLINECANNMKNKCSNNNSQGSETKSHSPIRAYDNPIPIDTGRRSRIATNWLENVLLPSELHQIVVLDLSCGAASLELLHLASSKAFFSYAYHWLLIEDYTFNRQTGNGNDNDNDDEKVNENGNSNNKDVNNDNNFENDDYKNNEKIVRNKSNKNIKKISNMNQRLYHQYHHNTIQNQFENRENRNEYQKRYRHHTQKVYFKNQSIDDSAKLSMNKNENVVGSHQQRDWKEYRERAHLSNIKFVVEKDNMTGIQTDDLQDKNKSDSEIATKFWIVGNDQRKNKKKNDKDEDEDEDDNKNLTFIEKFLEKINININTELILAKRMRGRSTRIDDSNKTKLQRQDYYSLYDIWSPGLHYDGQLNISEIGQFTIDDGFQIAPWYRRSSTVSRRQNMNLARIRSIVVVSNTNHTDSLEHYLTTPYDTHLDSMNRFNFALVLLVRDLFNFSLITTTTTSWGYLRNGKFDGMIGALLRKQADICGSPIFFRLERAKVIDYTARTWVARPCFIFRHPHNARNGRIVFLEPFDDTIWILLLIFGLITTILLWLFTMIDKKFEPLRQKRKEIGRKSRGKNRILRCAAAMKGKRATRNYSRAFWKNAATNNVGDIVDFTAKARQSRPMTSIAIAYCGRSVDDQENDNKDQKNHEDREDREDNGNRNCNIHSRKKTKMNRNLNDPALAPAPVFAPAHVHVSANDKKIDSIGSKQPVALFLDSLLFYIGSICQQGLAFSTSSFSGRCVVVTSLLFSFAIFQFYSASVVSTLLMERPKTIRTLQDLTQSSLDIGIEDTPYNRDYFRRTKDPDAIELYEKKMVNDLERSSKSENKYDKKNNSDTESSSRTYWYEANLGVKKIQKGKFAFHVDIATSYKIIAEKFTEKEICELSEIQLFPAQKMVSCVQKKSPLREVITYGLRRVSECGLMEYQRKIWMSPKPRCIKQIHTEDLNVDMDAMKPALLMLGLGFGLSFVCFCIEILVDTLRHLC